MYFQIMNSSKKSKIKGKKNIIKHSTSNTSEAALRGKLAVLVHVRREGLKSTTN